MGFQGEVLGNEPEGDVKVDLGGGDSAIADGFAPSGDDSPPLPGDAGLSGDTAALEEGVESGTVQAVGYHDNETTAVAKPGEKRIYSRASQGVLAVEIYLQKDGSILIRDHLGGGDVVIGAGEVTAKANTPVSVTLSGHQTSSPFGPLSIIPGT